MHELAVTKNIIEMILSESRKNNITPRLINAELGMLTTYKKDPILFYFDAMKKEHSLLSDSTLIIKEIKGKIRCKDCNKESNVTEQYLLFCPECNSFNITIIEGKDFKIRNIED